MLLLRSDLAGCIDAGMPVPRLIRRARQSTSGGTYFAARAANQELETNYLVYLISIIVSN